MEHVRMLETQDIETSQYDSVSLKTRVGSFAKQSRTTTTSNYLPSKDIQQRERWQNARAQN
jgi:hypothetical protein